MPQLDEDVWLRKEVLREEKGDNVGFLFCILEEICGSYSYGTVGSDDLFHN